MTIRIAILNDYELVVCGLAAMLSPFDDLEVVSIDVDETQLDHQADIALFDTYGRPGLPWPQLADLMAQPAASRIAVFTLAFEPTLVERALELGIRGYLWKGMPAGELARSLRRIHEGELVVSNPDRHPRSPASEYRWPFADKGLTARESEVLALLSEGLPNAKIAACMYLSTETIRSHVKQIFKKLDVHTRSEATAVALRTNAFARR